MDTQISSRERLEFSFSKVFSAFRWMAVSGTLTFALNEILKNINEFGLPSWALLTSSIVINSLLFGIAKFVEGSNK